MTKTFTINGKEVEFKKVSVIITEDEKNEEFAGLLLHDVDDTFHDGDAITTEHDELPEDDETAKDFLVNFNWDSDFKIENDKYMINI